MSRLKGRVRQLEKGLRGVAERNDEERRKAEETLRQIEAGRARAGCPPWWRPYPSSSGFISRPKQIDYREEILKGRYRAEELRQAWEDAGKPEDWSSRGPWPERG